MHMVHDTEIYKYILKHDDIIKCLINTYSTSDECQKEIQYNTDINLIHFMTIVTMIC